jgi:predicted ABC-type ATPase
MRDRGAECICRAILLIGGPGSGKTTLSHAFLEECIIRVDPDAVREQLPEYDQLVRQGRRDVVERTRDRVNQIADSLLEHAIHDQKSFVFDTSGRDAKWYQGFMRYLKRKGYEVTIVMIYTEAMIARERADERAEINKRHVDEDFFNETHSLVPGYFLEKYIPLADRFILIYNGGEHPTWVWYCTSEGEIIRNGDLLKDFLNRFEGAGISGEKRCPVDIQLNESDRWFEEIRQKMEASSSWDLQLETSYRISEDDQKNQ